MITASYVVPLEAAISGDTNRDTEWSACKKRPVYSCRADERRLDHGQAVRHVAGAARRAVAAQLLLRGDAALRPEGFHRLQPHPVPDELRRLRGGVLAPQVPVLRLEVVEVRRE